MGSVLTTQNNISYGVIDDTNNVEVYYLNDTNVIGNIIVPGSIVFENKKYLVTKIRGGAFNSIFARGSLIIGNNITEIGPLSFQYFSGINSLTLPNNLNSIGSNAFKDCPDFTGSLTIPNSVTTIGESSFNNCPNISRVYYYPNNISDPSQYGFGPTTEYKPISIVPINREEFYNKRELF